MKKYIIANWKSHKDLAQAAGWLNNFPTDDESRRVLAPLEIVLAPSYPLLSVASLIINERRLPIKLAVQDLSPFGAGAYTGEVAVENLSGLNVEYVILGHSERRRFLKETPQMIADKVKEARRGDFTPILCMDKGDLSSQANFMSTDDRAACIVAYEPASAIGNGQAQDPSDLLSMRQAYAADFATSPLLYGGSVNADNVKSYLEICDGVIVGTDSVDLRDFLDLLYAAV